MTNQSTIDKLIEMRLTAMADAFRIQMDDPAMKEVPFEDRFGMLVDVEYSNRKNNRLKRLIRQAEFEQPDASIAAIDYHSGRKLNKALINRLQPVNTLQNTGTSLLLEQPEVVKLTWPVPLAWRLVNSISIPGMSAFQICLLIWRWHGQMAATKKSWLSMPIRLS